MATASADRPIKRHPLAVTAVLSVIGYVLVIGTFTDLLGIFPEISNQTVILFGDLIAVINSLALGSLLLGFWFIRRGEVRKHRAAMLTAFSLILVFLVVYLWKVGGGFEKAMVETAPQVVYYAYLAMLAIHIGLSAVAVPVVLYPVVLGLTHTPAELADTAHARVGRIAVLSWSLSLFLGIVTYLLLNHVYGWVPR